MIPTRWTLITFAILALVGCTRATPVLHPAPPIVSCENIRYDENEWGDYPSADPDATPTWTEPYDSVNDTSLAHDHHVSRNDAHLSGGCHWSREKKALFSSDTTNLNPTTFSFNSSKGSRTPDKLVGIAKRIIDTAAEKCRYTRQHKAVKAHWQLSMTTAEEATVTAWLRGCAPAGA